MKQETKALVENAASRRMAQLRKQDPSLDVSYTMDENYPRAVIKLMRDKKVTWLEFVESAGTVGDASNLEDYAFCAQEFGGLTLHFPEALYPRDIAATIFSDIRERIAGAGYPEVKLAGYVYDDMGNLKKAF